MKDYPLSVEQLLTLKTRSGRQALGCFLVEGEKAVEEALESDCEVRRIYVTDTYIAKKGKLATDIPCTILGERQMHRLSSVATPPEIMGLVTLKEATFADLLNNRFIVCLDGVADPGNLGTIMRTTDWFGFSGLLLSEQGVDPFNEKVVRSTMGSFFRVKPYVSKNLLQDLKALKEKGFTLVVADASGGTSQLVQDRPVCLVLGSESHGVQPAVKDLADEIFSIPGKGQAESLNVAISAAIALYEYATGE